jgi:hypothetical protein
MQTFSEKYARIHCVTTYFNKFFLYTRIQYERKYPEMT